MTAIAFDQRSPEARQRAMEAARSEVATAAAIAQQGPRTAAIRVLAVVAELTPDQRDRVFRLALAMNEV